MDSNYEWQQFRANERAKVRRQEAEVQRRAKVDKDGRLPLIDQVIDFIRPSLSGLGRFVRRRGARADSTGSEMDKRERLA